MQNRDILDYVDQVVSKIDVPVEYKTKLENDLMKNIMLISDDSNTNNVLDILCSPEKLAEELMKKFESRGRDNNISERCSANGLQEDAGYPQPHHYRYSGEYSLEHSNVCLKLLYIPLLQISSGAEKLTMPLMEAY